MAMDLRDFFRLRCSQMLISERDIWQMNNLLSRQSHSPRLKEMLAAHSEPTRQQISNLEQVVDRLGGVIGPEESPLTQGLLRAHRQFMEMNPPQELIDLYNGLESEKTEYFEMASYRQLIAMARHLGEDEVATMLEQNLHGEERMAEMLNGELPTLMLAFNREGRKAA